MPTFATYPVEIISTGGDVIPERWTGLLEANSQSFDAGQLVYLDSGAVTAVASTGVDVLGIAELDATNVTSGNVAIPITVVKPDYLLKVRCTNNGTACTSESFVRGESYGIYTTNATATYADLNNTTNDALVFVNHWKTPDGDYTNWGIFKLDAAVSSFHNGTI